MTAPITALGEDISLEGSWQYSSNNPEDTEKIDAFNQRYSLQWNPRVTRAIFLDTNFNYSRNVTTGNIVRETLSPTATFQIQNDLFLTEISGLMNKTHNSQSRDQIDRNLEALLASNWDYQYWPSLSISAGRNSLTDDETVHVTDSDRDWSEFIAEWEGEGCRPIIVIIPKTVTIMWSRVSIRKTSTSAVPIIPAPCSKIGCSIAFPGN